MTDPAPSHTNRLIHETSPYLLQHAHNPVDWYPWGEEAFGRARAEDKPIFLSVGYAACHWCHVMERESFENEQVAAYLNEHFISIKVDREERPDVDDLYMQAVQILTGQGGWPMTVFLTHEGKPFFGGTYFPPQDRFGRIGFGRLLESIRRVWTEQRDEVDASSVQITEAILSTVPAAGAESELTRAPIESAVGNMRQRFDEAHGGFGTAPKFPPSFSMNLLMAEFHHTGDEALLGMVEKTLRKMAQGGIYDHVGGGFHRYSVDHLWLVPHFEKMLYDNALLAPVYFDAALLTGEPFYERVGRQILDYVMRDMTDPAGGFYSTQDADSEGVEGKYYLWTPEQVAEVLGAGDAELFCAAYDVVPGGNWPEGEGGSILNMPAPLEEFARKHDEEPGALLARLDAMRAKLLEARGRRVPPLLDDKVLTGWNGMMMTAMARGAQVTGEARYAEAARRAADFIAREMVDDEGRLLRSWRGGEAKIPAFLEDYAHMVAGLVDLYEATFDPELLERAARLADAMIARFHDADGGGFYTGDGSDGLIVARLKEFYDGATPSGNSAAVRALQRLGLLLDRAAYREAAHATLVRSAGEIARMPAAYVNLLAALRSVLEPGREVAVVGTRGEPETEAALRMVWRTYLPGRTIAFREADAEPPAGLALLADKAPGESLPTIFVCRDYACERPVYSAAAMAPLLTR